MAEKEVIKLLQKYIQILKEEGIKVDRAFLYGSYAGETQSEDSDIDLMLVSDQFNTSDDFLFGKIWVLTKKVDTKIEPYIVGSDKFEKDEFSPLIQLVKKDGFEIAC